MRRMLRVVGVPAVISLTWALPVHAALAESGPAIVTPSASAVTPPTDAAGDPLPFDITVSGFAPGEPVYAEICNGLAPSTRGYTPAIDCDNATALARVASAAGTTYFDVGTQYAPLPFRGASPSRLFNCLAPADVAGRRAGPYNPSEGDVTARQPGAYPPSGDKGYAGAFFPPQAANPTIASWDDCQLRVSSNDAFPTADQLYVRLDLSDGATAGVGVTTTRPPPGSPAAGVSVGSGSSTPGSPRSRHGAKGSSGGHAGHSPDSTSAPAAPITDAGGPPPSAGAHGNSAAGGLPVGASGGRGGDTAVLLLVAAALAGAVGTGAVLLARRRRIRT